MRSLRAIANGLLTWVLLGAVALGAYNPVGTSGNRVPLLSSLNIWSAAQVVSQNANASNSATSTLSLYGADASNAVGVDAYAFGAGASFSGTRYGGTAAALAVTPNNATIFTVAAQGYTGSATSIGARLAFITQEAWTASANGTRLVLSATKAGTTTLTTDQTCFGDYCSIAVPLSLSAPLRKSFTDSISAAGTTQGTATALSTDVNFVTTCASGAGVVLPAYNPTYGGVAKIEVFQEVSANACLVYPPSGASIKAGTTTNASNAAISLAAGGHGTFYCTSATLCRQGP